MHAVAQSVAFMRSWGLAPRTWAVGRRPAVWQLLHACARRLHCCRAPQLHRRFSPTGPWSEVVRASPPRPVELRAYGEVLGPSDIRGVSSLLVVMATRDVIPVAVAASSSAALY